MNNMIPLHWYGVCDTCIAEEVLSWIRSDNDLYRSCHYHSNIHISTQTPIDESRRWGTVEIIAMVTMDITLG